MLTSHDNGNLLNAIPDEPVNPPVRVLIRGEQLVITKDSDFVRNDSFHGIEQAPPGTTRFFLSS